MVPPSPVWFLFAVDALVVLGGLCHEDLIFLLAMLPITPYFLFPLPNPSGLTVFLLWLLHLLPE